MKTKGKTRRELFDELVDLRERVIQLEASAQTHLHQQAALEHCLTQSQILHDIARAGLERHPLDKIVQIALTNIGQLLPCRRVRLALFDFEARQTRVFSIEAVGKSSLARIAPNGRQPAGAGNEHMVQSHETLPLDEHLDLGLRISRTFQAEGIPSSLSEPLVAHDVTIGVITIWAPHSSGFSPDHLKLANQLAHELALALFTAGPYESPPA